jgi:hypothetical protein
MTQREAECPPLRAARQRDITAQLLARPGTVLKCPADEGKKQAPPCEVVVLLSIDQSQACSVEIQVETVAIDKPRRDPSVSWVLKAHPDSKITPDLSKFEFRAGDGLGIELLQGPTGNRNDRAKDLHDPRNERQKYTWNNRHSRKVHLRYCPHVKPIASTEDCAAGDPFILNQ